MVFDTRLKCGGCNGVGLDKVDGRLLTIIKNLHVANSGSIIKEYKLGIVST